MTNDHGARAGALAALLLLTGCGTRGVLQSPSGVAPPQPIWAKDASTLKPPVPRIQNTDVSRSGQSGYGQARAGAPGALPEPSLQPPEPTVAPGQPEAPAAEDVAAPPQPQP